MARGNLPIHLEFAVGEMAEQSGKIVCGERELAIPAMLDRAHRAARGLQSAGVVRDDAIAVVLRNDFPFFEAAYAANRLGVHLVPVNWHFSGPEVAYVLEDSGAKALIVHADLYAPIRAHVPASVRVFVVETPPEIARAYSIGPDVCRVRGGDVAWNDWLARFEPLPPEAVASPGSMIYTFGTTGRPKGVRRKPPTPEQATGMGQMVDLVMDFSHANIVALLTAPMYHATPNGFFRRAIDTNSTIVVEPRFDAQRYLELIDRHRITHAYAVATMFVRLLRLPDDVRERYDVSSLKVVVHGAAPTAPDVKRKMIDWFGPVLLEHYGSTELGAVVYCNSPDWLSHPGTVGKPLPHVELKVFDAERRELPPGEAGEIFARFKLYPDFVYQNDPAKRAAMEFQGLWTAGDIGYLDADGFLYLSDRKNDMVISGGVNIYPKEIETELYGLPGVFDCAVFGIPDEEFGEALAAVIQPTAGTRLDAAQVREFLRTRIAKYKLPKVIEFRDSLPREDSGKLFKRKLRDEYWKAAGRQI
ncbi:MAG TPA: acyl-CoA synthetase [Pseudomonadales bacterium]|nr:acyl-CoA synthetase [Pseudomonadales bacterium]